MARAALQSEAAETLQAYLCARGCVADPLAVTDIDPLVSPIRDEEAPSDSATPAPVVYDAVVLLGSADLSAIEYAAKLWRVCVPHVGTRPSLRRGRSPAKRRYTGDAGTSSSDESSDGEEDQLPPRGTFIVSGGVGHSTPHLYEMVRRDPVLCGILTAFSDEDLAEVKVPEAEIIAKALTDVYRVPSAAIVVESKSRNCGENAELSAPLVKAALDRYEDMPAEVRLHGASAQGQRRHVAIVQDATMQRRMLLTFAKHLRAVYVAQPSSSGHHHDHQLTSHLHEAPLVIACGRPHPLKAYLNAASDDGIVDATDADEHPRYSAARLASLLVGEIPRLAAGPDGYGPDGKAFQDADTPHTAAVREAQAALTALLAGVSPVR